MEYELRRVLDGHECISNSKQNDRATYRGKYYNETSLLLKSYVNLQSSIQMAHTLSLDPKNKI